VVCDVGKLATFLEVEEMKLQALILGDFILGDFILVFAYQFA